MLASISASIRGYCFLAMLRGKETKQGMIDAAQLARGDQHQGIALLTDVVDGERWEIVGHHQTSRPLEQNIGIAFTQLLRSLGNHVEINGSSIFRRCHVGRTGIGEDIGAGQAGLVLLGEGNALDAPVLLDVFRHLHTARLNHLLGNHLLSCFRQCFGDGSGGVGVGGAAVGGVFP